MIFDENDLLYIDEDTAFFKIMPYTETYLGLELDYVPLPVIQSSGVEVTPDLNINVTDLNRNDKNNVLYKQFHNNGSGGITFKISVILHKDYITTGYTNKVFNFSSRNDYRKKLQKIMKEGNFDYNSGGGGRDNVAHVNFYKEFNLMTVLDYFIKNMTPIMVQTEALDIPDGLYIITKNSKRKQSYNRYTEWELEFTTYIPITNVIYENDNALVKKAIKKAKAKQVKAGKSNKSSKTASTTKSKFAKCKISVLKYSKKKKTVKCVKYLQKILAKKKLKLYSGNIDGWYGSMTKTAVKKFQKKYKKKYGLKETGKVDKKTFNALKKV